MMPIFVSFGMLPCGLICTYGSFGRDSSLHLLFNFLKPTGHVMHQNVEHPTTVRSAHTVLMCFVFISEQTATYAT